MLAPAIAAQLRLRGWDVEAIQSDHPELVGLDDASVLDHATHLGRALVTDNVRHFLPLHSTLLGMGSSHAGLVLAHSRSHPRSKRTIGLWVRDLEALLRRQGHDAPEATVMWLR